MTEHRHILIAQTSPWEGKGTEENPREDFTPLSTNWQHPDSRFFLHHVSNLQHLPGEAGTKLEAVRCQQPPALLQPQSSPAALTLEAEQRWWGQRLTAKARGEERAAATRPQPLLGTPVCFHVFPSTQHPSRPNEAANSQHFLTSDRDDEANVTNV